MKNGILNELISTMQKAKLLQPDTIIRRKKMTIYICGDSTAATYPPENAPITGWGQLLGDYLPNVNVVNKAVGGRSTKSFLAEGRLTDIERTIQPGDLLLIQFTHNDTSDLVWRHTDPNTSFSANLEIYTVMNTIWNSKKMRIKYISYILLMV